MAQRPLRESDRRKTLQQLDGEQWPAPSFKSHLVTECHRLRTVPIGEFTVENLRIMIGQGFGLPWLVPVALERLVTHPFAEGDFHLGDLLLAVARVDAAFWQAHPDLMWEMQDVVSRAQGVVELLRDEVQPAWDAKFRNAERD